MRRSEKATWRSTTETSTNALSKTLEIAHFSAINRAQCTKSPIGTPRMTRLGSNDDFTTGGNRELPLLLNTSHFEKFKLSPKCGPSSSISCKAHSTADLSPARTPSSRYQASRSRWRQSSSASMLVTSL